MFGSLRRIAALMVKELVLMVKDPSAFCVGIVLPLMFVFLFGYGMSMDIKDIKLTIVASETNDTCAKEVISRFRDNGYFDVVVTDDTKEASRRLATRRADVVLRLSPLLDRTAHFGDGQFLIAVNGTEAPIAKSYKGTVEGLVQAVLGAVSVPTGRELNVSSRIWFNAVNNSQWYIVPGVIVIIMSVIGCLLTSMQVAKEYEFGTLESIFATPVTPFEVLVSKMLSNYILGMLGLLLSVALSRFCFGVPLRGSFGWLYLGSTIFLAAQMSMGLVISALTKNQFMAALTAANVSFMPAFLLSGFVYEIGNMPTALQWVTALLPARYYCDFAKTAFLVGDDRTVYLRTLLPLAGFLVVFLAWGAKTLTKQQKEKSK